MLCLVFIGSFFASAFISHSFTPAYDSRAEDTIYSDFVENPTLSFTVTDPTDNSTLSSIDLSTSPNTLATKTVNLLVSTDSSTGYVLSFSDDDEDTALYLDGDSTSAFSVPSLTTTADASSFPANGWGYLFGTDTNFSPIPPLSTPQALASTTSATDDTYAFTIAAKADLSKAAGTYTDTIVFSVVANPAPRVYLQDLTTEQCKNLELEKQYLYYDRRDEKAYTIARLADNNCWMTSNLRLGNEEGGDSITLNSQDTNLAPGETFILPASKGGVWATSDTDQTNAETKRLYSNGSTWLEDDFTATDQSANIKTSGTPNSPSKYIGNYYNWYTATAGTGRYSNTTTNTTHDICPKGWRLPSGGDNGEQGQLLQAYNIDNMASDEARSLFFRSAPFNFILSGGYPYTATSMGQGASGFSMSSTPHSSIANRELSNTIRYYTVDRAWTGNYKQSGASVRCIYQPTIEGLDSELSYMQDMTDAICKATPTPLSTDNVVPQATLIDIRGKDGSGTVANPVVDKNSSNYQTYIVRKLADGNCWMVQNLNMTLSTNITLDSTTTDIGNATADRTFTPQYNTQTAEGTAWAQSGGDVARSFEPGENIYFPGGVGTGTIDTSNGSSYNYSGYNTTGDPWYHIGNYYNWYAATAGTGLATTATNDIETTVPDSICPKNWRLPDNEGNKSFINLVFNTYGLIDNDATSATNLLASPLNFVHSGHYSWSGGNIRNRGHYGHWWSRAAYATMNARYLSAGTGPSRVIPQQGANKGYGLAVRCVAR